MSEIIGFLVLALVVILFMLDIDWSLGEDR